MIGFGLIWAMGIVFSVVIIGHMIKWLLEWVLAKSFTERDAAIASFAAMLGHSLWTLAFDLEFDYIAVSEKIGLIIGLAALWWSFFKRRSLASGRLHSNSE